MSDLSSDIRFEHKGYTGLAKQASNRVFYGKVSVVQALLMFEGATLEDTRRNFESIVDEYISQIKWKKALTEVIEHMADVVNSPRSD